MCKSALQKLCLALRPNKKGHLLFLCFAFAAMSWFQVKVTEGQWKNHML